MDCTTTPVTTLGEIYLDRTQAIDDLHQEIETIVLGRLKNGQLKYFPHTTYKVTEIETDADLTYALTEVESQKQATLAKKVRSILIIAALVALVVTIPLLFVSKVSQTIKEGFGPQGPITTTTYRTELKDNSVVI